MPSEYAGLRLRDCHEKPNRRLGHYRRARCCCLESLHRSDSFEPAGYGRCWSCSGLLDLPNRDGPSTRAGLLLRPHCKRCDLCVGRLRDGSRAAAPRYSLNSKLTHDRTELCLRTARNCGILVRFASSICRGDVNSTTVGRSAFRAGSVRKRCWDQAVGDEG